MRKTILALAMCVLCLQALAADKYLIKIPPFKKTICCKFHPPFQFTFLYSPDFIGQKIHVRLIDSINPYTKTIDPAVKTSETADFASIATPNCEPNSVLVHNTKLYVACTKDNYGGKNLADKILVFDISNFSQDVTRSAPLIKTISSNDFDGLIALAADPAGNIWVSSYNNNRILQITSSQLSDPATAQTIEISRGLVNSPTSPAGITFDSNGALWAVSNGLAGVYKFDKSELYKNAANAAMIDASPSLYLENQQTFDAPEGIALLNGKVYVSNNGGEHPGKSIVALDASNLSVSKNNAFSCPGGLLAYKGDLYVNDESMGLQNTTCGASDASEAVDGIAVYAGGDLSKASRTVWHKATSRPGFGGISIN